MDENVDLISLFKKFPRGVSLERSYRVATVDEAKRLFEAIQAQSQNVASSAPHELLPGSKNELFSLKDGYLFDFGPISTFYPDIDNKFLWRHKLGVSQDFQEVEGASLCLPLALLHACAEEDEKEIRDLVMVQSVHATFGRHVHHEHEQEHVVPSRSISRGFAAVQGFDGRISNVLHDEANYYPGMWGCRSGASSHDAAAAASCGDASNLPSALEFYCWPPAAGLPQTIDSQRARLALLNAYTAWPKNGGTALHFAARTRKSAVVALLLDLEIQVMRQMQLNASASTAPASDQSILIGLAAAGLNGSNFMLNTPDIDGNNALCCAAEAEEDNSKVVDLLLRRDQPIMEFGMPCSTLFHQNKMGMSALLIAASKGHVSTLCCLLQAFSSKLPIKTRVLYKATLRQPFFELTGGNNFIHYCVARGDIHFFTEVLGLMPSNWHSITQLMLCFPDNLGVTALELALAKGYSEICELVLKKMNELMSGSAMDLKIVEAGIGFIMSQSERDCDGNNILHLYALGGGSKEVGKELTEWVELLMSSLDTGRLFSSLPSSAKGLYIGLNKIEAMINQLNCAGETPCITALRRGHSDALQVLMPIWREGLATHYLNPRTRDTVLHCYAQSSFPPNFDHNFFIHHCTVNSSLMKQLLNTRNTNDHTPILSSLYSGQTTSSAWFLSQEDVQIEQRDHVLHVYACCCDDEALGKALQAKLGQERVQAEMKESVRLKVHRRGCSQGRTTMKGTPLMLAVAGGNLQAYAALLRVQDGGGGNYTDFNESMDDHQNNVLHMLCRNKSANINIEEGWKMIVTAKVTDTSDFAKCLINARNNDGDTPLRLALKSGNIKACEWLLDARSDLLMIDPLLDGRAVFDRFEEGHAGVLNLAVWKKLKAAYCKNDPNLLQHAKKVLSSSLLNAISTNFEDFMQCFIKDEDVMAIIYAEDTSFWSSYQDHLSGLRCLNNLIEMCRHTHLAQRMFDKETMFLAAMKGNFELFELTLQAQSYDCIEEEFNQDKYQKLLKHVLYSPMSSNLMLLLIQKIQMENCNSLFISWQRFLDLMGGQYDAIGGWMWAHEFLAVQRMAPFALDNSNMLPPEGQEMEQNRLMDQEKHFMEAVDSFIQRQSIEDGDDDDNDSDGGDDNADGNCETADTQRVLSIVRTLCQRPGVLQGGLPLLQTLLDSVDNDNPQLVSLLLIILSPAPFGSADTSVFDATMVQVLVSFCRSNLLHNIHAVLHVLFYPVYETRSRLRAFLTNPVDPRLRGNPFFLHCAAKLSAMAAFIKLLNFAQSCQADDMVDYQGQTALHLACALQRNKIFHTLVCMCPRLVNVPASRGRTPLMLAALHGSVQMVKSLLPLRKRGLSFERDADGRTPLHYAAQSPRSPVDVTVEVIQLLLSRARQDEDSALLLWAMAGQTSNAGTADAFAMNSSIAEFLQARMKEEKMTRSELLQLSIDKENMVMVRDLINRGADTSMLDRELFSKLGLYETKQVDQPTSKDSLGRASLSKGIASLFLNPLTSVPITVGVLGAWGMGKSSIMLQTEITLMMTIIARNLLSTKEDFPSVIQGKIINTEVEKLQHDVLATVDNLTQPQLKHNKFLHQWPNAKKKHKDEITRRIEDLLSVYRPECMPLYKGLALMSRHKLFQCPSLENETSFSLEIPTCLTIYYNAWLYHGESDASSGLALTIIKELEGCMNTAQWLKLCWNYAYRLDPIFIFGNITLPLLVMVVIGGWIVWIIWKLLSIPSLANQEGLNSFKYGSIPVSTVIIAWIILRNIMNVLKPVSEQILKSLNTSQKYQEKLGYQQQIVNDIQFFKDQLGQEIGFGWKVVGRIWSLIVENKDNIPKTNIRKAFVSIDKLRIVVFIDDLDRCSKPTYVIELLGATNLFLSTCAINVVLGMNKDIIKEVISGEYKGDIEATEKFLEKVIHVPIDLYEPNEEETSNFLQEQLMFVNPKEKKQPSTSFNQEIFNTCNQRHKKVKQGIPSPVSDNEPSRWDMNSKDVRPLQGHVTVDLQEGSSSMSNLLDQEKEDIFIETQVRNEALEPPASNIKEGEMMYNTGSSKKNDTDVQRTSNAKQNEDGIWQKWSKNEDIRFVVEFPLLVANYNEAEVRVVKELQKRAKGEQKKPRNWKRLLSYHQLVRSIISHSKVDRLSYIYGWQEQLIIWLFVCYNWKEQMNEIFENWGKLVIVLRQSPPMLMPLQPSLHLIVDLQKQNYEELVSSENLRGAPNSSHQRHLEDWRKLEETLYGAYDVDMESVNIFQKYRFHCNIGHIHWEDGIDLSKTRDE